MNEFHTLVSASQVRQHRQWRLFDCRHDLGQPEWGLERYAQGHLPGAVHAHLDRDLSGHKSGRNGRHPLPERATFRDWLERQGVTGQEQIVAYDDAGGAYAARLWWLLRWMGHARVAVLDGGLAAWQAMGGELTSVLPRLERARFESAGAPLATCVDVEFVQDNLARRQAALIDARGAGRYAGVGETIDPVAGHIPGALNRPYLDNLDATGHFKPASRLRDEFTRVLGSRTPGQVVSQCGSGVTACHNLLAMEHAGLSGARLYPGSWSEWCSDAARAVAVGGQP
jgi:thiosulfate/3-mercaptopyruvate sulfurtransferase